MQLLKKYGIIIFWFILAADCFLLYQEQHEYHGYLKAALMPVLIFYVFLNARKNHYLTSKSLVFSAMLFSWIGDLLLINNSNTFFLWGMIAFLIAHIFYIIFFRRLQPLNPLKATEATIATVVLIAIYYQLFKFLKPELAEAPSLRVPIYIYAVVIGIMAVMATNVFSNKSRRSLSINFFIPGVALFIFSDIVLVLHKFKYTDTGFLEVVIMVSYGYAQCLLAQGFTKYLKG